MTRLAIISAVTLGIALLATWIVHQHTRRTFVTTILVDDEKKTLYHAISEEYRFVRKSISSKERALGLQTLLLRIRTHTEWYPGRDGTVSHMQVDASIVDSGGKVGRKLWTIRHDGHELWDNPDHGHMQILERACCDGLNRLNTYDASTGRLIESHDVTHR